VTQRAWGGVHWLSLAGFPGCSCLTKISRPHIAHTSVVIQLGVRTANRYQRSKPEGGSLDQIRSHCHGPPEHPALRHHAMLRCWAHYCTAIFNTEPASTVAPLQLYHSQTARPARVTRLHKVRTKSQQAGCKISLFAELVTQQSGIRVRACW
jgi:hypothetical protein